MKALIFSLSILLTQTAFAETKEFDAKYLQVLRLNNGAGKVNVSTNNSGKATVTVTKLNFNEEKCNLIIEKEKDTLKVVAERKSMFTMAKCEANLDVKIPKAMNVYLVVGAGSVAVSGTEGLLDFKLGAGDLRADGRFSSIQGTSGAGAVAVKGLTGGGNIMTGSGSISLAFAKAALNGEIDLKTGSGDATLEFAKGTKIRTSFAAGVGEMINEIGDTENAPFRVVMKSGAGGLKIKSY